MHPGLTIRFLCRGLVFVIILIIVSGCEAPLHMEDVEQGLTEPVRRSDQFQMADANKNAIVVVGNQGLILVSTDDGETWRRNKLPDWPALIDVSSCPDGSFAALAAEGQVWVSTDDGGQWTPSAIESEEAPQAITCDPQNRIWVVGSFSSIFSSSDAGANWEFTSLDEDTILTNILFVDTQTAFISGEFGTVLKSTDAGLTWERLPELDDTFYPQAMYFEDHDRGWIAGLQGQILYTQDSGESWELQQTDTLAPLYGLEKAGSTLYAVGGDGTVLQQHGQRWSRLEHGQPILLYLRAVLALGSDKLLVAGQAGALYVLPLGGH